MSGQSLPQMSLVAQVDDFARQSTVLIEGVEHECIKYIEKIKSVLQQLEKVKEEKEELHRLVKKYQSDNNALKLQWKQTKNLFEREESKRIKAESERDALERQILLIKELLMSDQNMINDQTKEKLAFLNGSPHHVRTKDDSPPGRLQTIEESAGSVLSPSDLSFDKTDEDLDYRGNAETKRYSNGKRSKSPSKITPTKKRKSQEIEGINEDPKVTTPSTHLRVAPNIEDISPLEMGTLYPRFTRSSSEPAPALPDALSPPPLLSTRTVCKSDSDNANVLLTGLPLTAPSRVSLTPSVQRTPSGRSPLPHINSKASLKTRAHIFCTKTVLRPETCLPCGRRIKFYKTALKCQDCKSTCHPECKEQMPLPCIPTVQTPTGKGIMGTIADYTPAEAPMIPALIVHCINEIEGRGFSEIGLYRISGAEKDVRDLKEKFLKGKGIPILAKADIHTICGVVKDFLRSLQDPLITRTYWKEFVQAAEMTDESAGVSAIYQAVSQLPQPNRDTLAYLILHLQRIASIPDCKMPVSNLAKVFGPNVVGFSVPDPAPVDMITETKKQHAVMEKLLSITSDYWTKFVSGGENQTSYPPTPDMKPGSQNRLLRSLSGRNQPSKLKNSRSVAMGKIPLTPRNTESPFTKTTRQPRFFASPILK